MTKKIYRKIPKETPEQITSHFKVCPRCHRPYKKTGNYRGEICPICRQEFGDIINPKYVEPPKEIAPKNPVRTKISKNLTAKEKKRIYNQRFFTEHPDCYKKIYERRKQNKKENETG